MNKLRGLIDVDGVCADLMAGFKRWLHETFGENLDISKITRFHLPTSPELKDLHERVNLDECLDRFLGEKDVYQRYVSPVPGAVAALASLRELIDPVFVTATLKNAPESYASKFLWCRDVFGDVPMIACPSHLKFEIKGTFGVDDRADTCGRWIDCGVKAFLFKQPWNEAPQWMEAHDWPMIVDSVESIIRRWSE